MKYIKEFAKLFYLACIAFFINIVSTSKYEWMLDEDDTEITKLSQLPVDDDRIEMALLAFLFMLLIFGMWKSKKRSFCYFCLLLVYLIWRFYIRKVYF